MFISIDSFVPELGAQFREYLAEHGYDISQMGLHDEASSSRVDSIDVPEKKIEA